MFNGIALSKAATIRVHKGEDCKGGKDTPLDENGCCGACQYMPLQAPGPDGKMVTKLVHACPRHNVSLKNGTCPVDGEKFDVSS